MVWFLGGGREGAAAAAAAEPELLDHFGPFWSCFFWRGRRMQMQMFQDVWTIHARVVVDFVDRRFMYFSDVIVVVVDGMDGTSHVWLELIDRS